MFSVIIPAYNEENVIGRCLQSLLDGARDGEMEVIVACNGCSDRTAERARAFGHPVQVVEIREASKTAALNAADRIAKGFPRLYVDADVILPLESARKVVQALDQTDALLASPVALTHTDLSSKAVQAFYDVWLRLPYNQVMVGTGVYALSEAGRRRFGKFPRIISDDGFVRTRFRAEERIAVRDAVVTVIAPRTVTDLVKVKSRIHIGRHELNTLYPAPESDDPKRPLEILGSLPWSVRLPFSLTVYILVNVAARLHARRRLRSGATALWDRDEAARAS